MALAKSTIARLRNKFERSIYDHLKRAKARFKYEPRKIPYVLACFYTPDWEIETNNGLILIESKGYFRAADKRKLRAVKKQHPELDIRILFYAPNDEYERWAVRNGFRYAISVIPKEWLEGY